MVNGTTVQRRPGVLHYMTVKWLKGAAKGTIDAFPVSCFSRPARGIALEHPIFSSRRSPIRLLTTAKCLVSVTEKMARLDYGYEPFRQFNKDRGVLLGVTTLRFASSYRNVLSEFGHEWLPEGSKKPCVDWLTEVQVLVPANDPPLDNPREWEIVERAKRRQARFRQDLLSAYNCACAVTGYSIPSGLEAAHVNPVKVGGAETLKNGVLLRSDLHRLFDDGFMAIDPTTMLVHFAPEAREWPEYQAMHGRKTLWLPTALGLCPSPAAFQKRWLAFKRRHRLDS